VLVATLPPPPPPPALPQGILNSEPVGVIPAATLTTFSHKPRTQSYVWPSLTPTLKDEIERTRCT
jgi:hypothetical protein